MNSNAKKTLLASLLLPFLVMLIAQPGFGIWNTLLNDHFDNDQSELVTRWPWNTPFQNPNIGWYYNPLDPYPNATGAHRSDYSWGWQNFIYNVNVVDRAEHPGSIWCAYTNRNDINNPRWPEDDDYMNNQLAWAWWGPMDLRQAVSGMVSWWMIVDLANYNYDSLSVVIFTPQNLATIPGNLAYNQPNFRTNQPFGAMRDGDGEFAGLSIFNSTSDGWVQRSFQLDDLRRLDAAGEIVDSVSYLGRNNVWLGFVWNTNGAGIVGKGAFIDDVVVGLDDGLFDLSIDKIQFGYAHDEQIEWNDVPPSYGENTRFRLEWLADGSGETPAFNVTCSLDGRIILDEERQVVAGTGQAFSSETPGFWHATAGEHTILWTLDRTNAVEESIENNNAHEFTFEVPWIPPPTMTFIQPDHDILIPVDSSFNIVVAVTDSNETDTSLTAYLFWTKDTSGFAGHPEVMYDWHYILHRFDLPQGRWSVPFNFEEAEASGEVDVGDRVFVAGFVSDLVPGNIDFEIASGRITIGEPVSVSEYPTLPLTAFLVSAYPNPFNSDLRIDYNLVRAGELSLKIFDLAGREVAELLRGSDYQSGWHSATWKPSKIGAGVYVVRLGTSSGVILQKVVYTP